MDLGRLTTWRKIAIAGGGLGAVGFLLPWFEIYGRPRAGFEMILGTGGLGSHATPELLLMWAGILSTILVAVLVGTLLTLAPAWGGRSRPGIRTIAGTAGTVICALLLVLGFVPGVGYWATFAGAGLLVLGNRRADGTGSVSRGSTSATRSS